MYPVLLLVSLLYLGETSVLSHFKIAPLGRAHQVYFQVTCPGLDS